MFPISKDGFRFSFEEDGLQITRPDSRETHFSFSEKNKLKQSPWLGTLSLSGKSGAVKLSVLDDNERKALILEFFQRWKRRNPEASKKAAFDYIDGQRGFIPVAFVACLFFCLPLSIGLLADSREQFGCTKELRESSVLGTMDVTKFSKKRKGHYTLDLSFTAPNGEVIVGNDQLITEDETSIPKSVPVVYSPANPHCWSLTPNLAGTEVNWAQRRYFGYFTGLFGGFFLITSLIGIAWAIARWRHPRPYMADLKEMFQLE